MFIRVTNLLFLAFLLGLAPQKPTRPPVTFEEVSPATSKITWKHDNAHSPDRQLPETVGAGCAFLDYDNDGWMDIYFVNSGPSDFFTPSSPLKNALYRNNRDGTFTDVTDKAGVAGGKFGMGVASRPTTTATATSISTSLTTVRTFFIATTATALSLTSPTKRA